MGVLEGQAAGRRIRATGCAGHPCEGPHFKYDRPVDARNEVAENLRLGQVQHEECADPVRANEGDGGVPAQGGRDLRSNLWVRSKRLRKNRLNWGGRPTTTPCHAHPAVVQMAIADSLGTAQPRSGLATAGTFSHSHCFRISVISDVSTQSAQDVVVRLSARSTTVRTNLRSLQGS